MCGIAYSNLCRLLIKAAGPASPLAVALGKDWKGRLSTILNIVAVFLAFLNPLLGLGVYFVVAIMWFIPDRRIEKAMN
jgi:hypothetical protein